LNFKYPLIFLVVASALTSCVKTPAEQNAVDKKEVVAKKRVEIPNQFQGVWSQDCTDKESISNLIIEPGYLHFYESSGPIQAVVNRGEFEVALISELSGEGEVWLSFSKFRLAGENKNLIDIRDDENGYVRYKCDEDSSLPAPRAAVSE